MFRISWFVRWSRQQCVFWMFSLREVSPPGAPASHNPKGRLFPRRRALPRGLSTSRGGGCWRVSQRVSQKERGGSLSEAGFLGEGGFGRARPGGQPEGVGDERAPAAAAGEAAVVRREHGGARQPGAGDGRPPRPPPGPPPGQALRCPVAPEGDSRSVPAVNFAEGAVVIAKRERAGGESADSCLYHKPLVNRSLWPLICSDNLFAGQGSFFLARAQLFAQPSRSVLYLRMGVVSRGQRCPLGATLGFRGEHAQARFVYPKSLHIRFLTKKIACCALAPEGTEFRSAAGLSRK